MKGRRNINFKGRSKINLKDSKKINLRRRRKLNLSGRRKIDIKGRWEEKEGKNLKGMMERKKEKQYEEGGEKEEGKII